MIDRLREPIERSRNIPRIRVGDVTPDGIRTARKPQHISRTISSEGQRQSRLIGFVTDHACECHGQQLRQMRNDAHSPVVGFRVAPHRYRFETIQQLDESFHAWVNFVFFGNQRIGSAPEQMFVGALDAGDFFSGNRMSAQETGSITEMLGSFATNENLGATRVGDQRF
jgi:hypothetical protein